MEQVKSIPANYQRIMPYLIIKDAGKFIDFMRNVFDATEQYKHMRDENHVMHAEISINGSTVMFADCNDEFPQQNAGMFIYVDSCDETYKKAINNGAESLMPPADQPYGRSAGVKDPFGNTWWLTNPL